MTNETPAYMVDECIDLDLMWLTNIAYEAEQGKPADPKELRDIATALATYLRILRSECERNTRIIADVRKAVAP